MAVYDAHANLAVSTVATAPSPATSGTSLVVGSGEGTRFPATPFNATLWPANTRPDPSNAEIVRVTAISTDTFTITRAQESTSAKTVTTSFLIAATISAKTVTDLETNTEYAFSAWKDFGPTFQYIVASTHTGGTTYIVHPTGLVAINTATSAFGVRYFDPSDVAGSRTTKVRFRVNYEVGGTGPGTTLTWALASVATWRTAAAAERAGVATVNTALVSAAVATGSLGANTQGHSETGTATLTAGYYVVTVVPTATPAANSNVEFALQLQYQAV